MKPHFYRLIVVFIFASISARGADGDLDPSFSGDGIVTTTLGLQSHGVGMVIQPDQRIIVVGSVTQSTTDRDVLICRYLADGSLDASFGGGDGIVTTDLGTDGDRASHVILQPNGQILVSGARSTVVKNVIISDWALMRYQSDGTLDSSFGTNGVVFTDFGGADFGGPIALMADGRIVMTGFANNSAGIARFTSAGTPDNTFSYDGKVLTTVGSGDGPAMILLSDGKIIIGGTRRVTTDGDAALTRYLADGTQDATFGTNGITITRLGNRYDSISELQLLPDGQIVAAGRTQVGTSGDERIFLTRYSADGVLSTSFGSGGISTLNLGTGTCYVCGLSLGTQGKLILAAESRSGNLGSFSLVRTDRHGALDRSLGGTGYVNYRLGTWNERPGGLALQSDGKIVMAGYSKSSLGYQVSVVRLVQDATPEIGVFVGNSEVQHAGSYAAVVRVGGEVSIPYRVQNDGQITLAELSHTLSGPDAADFILPTLPASLSPETSTQGLQILFRPREAATSARQATLTINSNDGNEAPFVVTLIGEVGTPPIFTQPPQSQFMTASGATILSLEVTGLGPFTYQWMFNDFIPSNSTSSTFWAYRAAAYTVTVTNRLGSTSSTAYLCRVQGNSFYAPGGSYIGRNFFIQANAEAPRNTQLTYQWQRDGVDLIDGPHFYGATQSFLNFLSAQAEASGSYSCQVTMTIPGGATYTMNSPPTQITVVEAPPTVLNPSPELITRLNVPINRRIEASGAPISFTVTDLPLGMSFDQSNGFLSGTPILAAGTPLPHIFEFDVTAISTTGASSPKRLKLTVLPAMDAGNYSGMLDAFDFSEGKIGGSLQFTVTPSGRITGSVSSHGIVRRFSGSTSAVSVTGIPLARVPGEGLRHLYLFPAPDSGDVQYGAIGAPPGASPSVSESLTFFRNQHSSKVGARAGRYRGIYNVLFNTPDDQDPNIPAGFGLMQASLSPTGIFSWTGRLADNTSIIGSTAVQGVPGDDSIEHAIPFWSGLYGNKGAVTSLIMTKPASSSADEAISIGNQVFWYKPITPRDRSYPNGINGLALPMIGSQYIVPSATLNPLGLPRSGTASAATLTVSGANVPDMVPLDLGFGPAGQLRPKAPSAFRFFNVPAGAAKAAALDMSSSQVSAKATNPLSFGPTGKVRPKSSSPLRPANMGAGGFFIGDVTFRDTNPRIPSQTLTRTSVFIGLFVPSQRIGGGFFSITNLPTAGPPATTLSTAPISSGRIIIAPSADSN